MKYFCVIDFECTCDAKQTMEPEIIEFPAVFVNPVTLKIEFEFREYVRPETNPVISDYCTELTGITQLQVDDADPLAHVLVSFASFLDSHEISSFA